MTPALASPPLSSPDGPSSSRRELELDEVGAEIAARRGAVRTGDDTREIEDANDFQHGNPAILPCVVASVKAPVRRRP